MTMTDPARKRANPFWLWAPYVVVALVFAGWTGVWFEIRNQVATAMDQAASQAKQQGLDLGWKDRTIGGYPFRIMIELTQPELGEPSGWRLTAPRIKAVANAYDLDHWVIATSQGVVLTRPGAGATAIAGDVLRASWVGQGDSAPRIVVEGLKLTFTPQPGAKPFPLTSADRAVFYTRTLPADQVEARLFLDGAQASPDSRLSAVTGPATMALMWQGTLSHLSAFHGRDAASAARAWSAAGGTLTTTLGGMAAGGRTLGVHASQLSTDADGRLVGDAQLEIKGGGDALRALGAVNAIDPDAAVLAGGAFDAVAGGDGKVRVDLGFQDGATSFGPFPIAPSPKLF
jgi:hypothetical protein